MQPALLRSLVLALSFTVPADRVAAQETPPPAGAQQGEQGGERDRQDGDDKEAAKKKKDRPGIPVEDPLVHTFCVSCHALDDRQHMTRISYLRKSPEGWAETLKRMIRLYDMKIDPADAKEVVRSLANTHGLARSEAERGLYESERRVHWSEEEHDQDFRRACSTCHPLGRVLLQQRDEEEWQLLRATHVAMFPLARGQMGGGPPRDTSSRRFGGGGFPGGGAPPGATSNQGATSNARTRGGTGGRGTSGAPTGQTGQSSQRGSRGSVGDRVLAKLAKDQPLFSDAWKKWTKNRRVVPLAGTWTVAGHEVGRGDLFGTATITRTGEDEYAVDWQLTYSDGTALHRTGKGLLYAGYSWRGRSSTASDAAQWREVLLLDDAWNTMRGRTFTGTHDEVGADLTLHRQVGRPRVVALGNRAAEAGSTGHVIDVYGEAFSDGLLADSFFVGEDVTITAVDRVNTHHVRLTVDVAADAELGRRVVAFGTEPGSVEMQVYDTVDFIRITPLQGLSRVGGASLPAQIERFEAIAMNRGPDKKLYTDDDIDLFQVRPKWGLAEFKVRHDDDDLEYVGKIDAVSGVFTPAIDGPNPKRKWSANNIGEVFVTAEIELEVPVRPPEEKPKEADGEETPDQEGGNEERDSDEEVVAAGPTRERRTFKARSHLIVTVPLYVKWAALDWEDR